MKALPDLEIEVQCQHVTDDAILVEVMIRGTHLGAWRGLPPTGRRMSSRSAVCTRSMADDRLAGEKIYYDRGTVLSNLASSTSRKACWDNSPFWRLIPPPLCVLSRGNSCAGEAFI